MTCWCGHGAEAHRATLLDPSPSRTGAIRSARHECRAEWTERGGMDRVSCNCEQYAPARDTPSSSRWSAEFDEDADWPNVWRPRLHTRLGHTASLLNVWFESRETCESWIRAYVIGIENVG